MCLDFDRPLHRPGSGPPSRGRTCALPTARRTGASLLVFVLEQSMGSGSVPRNSTFKQILIADDDEAFRRACVRNLGSERRGFAVGTVAHALDVARQETIDLAIVDLRMGGDEPRWTGQIRPVVDGSNPASCSRTGSRSAGRLSRARSCRPSRWRGCRDRRAYRLVSWLRRGAAAHIQETDGTTSPLRSRSTPPCGSAATIAECPEYWTLRRPCLLSANVSP
jgi:hypothetical protein